MRIALVTAAAAGLLFAPQASARPIDKLDAGLQQLAAGKRAKPAPGGALVQPVRPEVRGGKVLVDVYVRGPMRYGADALRGEGMRVEAISGRSPQRVVEGWVPISALDDVAGLSRVRGVIGVVPPIYNTGAATSEGDAKHRGPQVRAQGFTGAGIPVGVMSDSINQRGTGVAGSQGTNDLPATVQILEETGSTDEGRAMAQIVYDEAPGIPKIVFATGGGGPVNRAENIDALVAAGSKVIADDVVYLSQPVFQDGVVAQAADRAKANGAAYFVSAGNRAREAWEGTFTPASPPALNDFDPGPGVDSKQKIATVPNTQQLSIFVHWANPLGKVTDDFALDLYNADSDVLLGTVDTNNVASGIPFEGATITGTAGDTPLALTIRRVAGSGNPRLKWIANGAFTGPLPAEFNVNASGIDPDAASARGALAVAAVRHNDMGNDSVESFSSRGPSITRLFDANGNALATPDVRAKPDIAGADGVDVTNDFGVGTPDLDPFFGTSAAAPSAAGVGALLLSAKPSLPVDELYAILRDPRGSIDCTSASGFPDADCGSGFILADGKLAMVLDSSAPGVAAVTSPGGPDGANGWFHSNVGLTWSAVDAESPVGIRSGCDPQTVASDGAAVFTCSATSAGGTTSQPVTIRRDTVPPAAPAFTGITAGAKLAISKVPPESAIGCTSSDGTSGLASCVVSGYSAALGSHTLTATATDVSGLQSTSALTYSVVLPGARNLALARRQTIRSVLRSGFKLAFTVGGDKTVVSATLKVGRTTVGKLRSTRKGGKTTLKIKLSKAGKKKLRRARKAKFALTVRASGPNVDTTTLKKSVTLKR